MVRGRPWWLRATPVQPDTLAAIKRIEARVQVMVEELAAIRVALDAIAQRDPPTGGA